MRIIVVGALLVGIFNINICESANTNICGGNDCCLDGTSGGGYLKCGHGKFLINSNLDITNKSVRPFLFTISNYSLISNVIFSVNPQNGSWV